MYVKMGPYPSWFGPFQLAEKILFWKDKDDDAVFDLERRSVKPSLVIFSSGSAKRRSVR